MLLIESVSGPLVKAVVQEGHLMPKVNETVYVGQKKLLGEVISIYGNLCNIQVFEDTSGITVGEKVVPTGTLLSVELGPGLVGAIFDGIQRPLKELEKQSPLFIAPGIHIPAINPEQKWEYIADLEVGNQVTTGTRIGYCQESSLVKHWIMVPPVETMQDQCDQIIALPLTLEQNNSGTYTTQDKPFVLKDANGQEIKLGISHKWPVKIARPFNRKLPATKLFQTGSRVIDGFFPILLGAPVSTPGPFGAGKTVTQQQIAKWSDAQIVVYVGCGERGNEMTEMVKLFPEIIDPKTGKPLMDRTIMIANTSNMPIAAREASIYTGITIAEYYRDMGYNVVMMADSTSRWAEAMREVSARMGELPAEEGYPAYLSSRLAGFYARAGQVETHAGHVGSVTAIGTVSPAGGDFSEPVTQVSLRNSQVFLALDASLSAKRHFPAINWEQSYSLYIERIRSKPDSFYSHGGHFMDNVKLAKQIVGEETSLLDMIKLVGLDGLSADNRLTIEIGRSVREDFLQQDGFDPVDTYSPLEKTQLMIGVIIAVYKKIKQILKDNPEIESIHMPQIFTKEISSTLANLKYSPKLEIIPQKQEEILDFLNKLDIQKILN